MISSSDRKAGQQDGGPVESTRDLAFFSGFSPDCFPLPDYQQRKNSALL
jgi:hypothetical protein